MDKSGQQKKNSDLLNEADKIQDKTIKALQRAQKDASRTEELGAETLLGLSRQGDKMGGLDDFVDHIHHKLEKSSVLQRNFERLTGGILGIGHVFDRSKSPQDHGKVKFTNVKEVFEDQTFDALFRSWKPHALVECANPTKECPDLFDPAVAEKMEHSSWIIDYSMASIDSNGWTYATTFSALNSFAGGQASPQFNSFVRRRKWRHVVEDGSRSSSPIKDMVSRNDKRKNSSAEDMKPVKKIGYVPRDRQDSLTDTGLTSAGMLSRSPSPSKLDPASAAGMARLSQKDAQIDKELDVLGNSVDRIRSISDAMKTEVAHQNQRLDKLEGNLDASSDKLKKVNVRGRRFLNTN